MLTSCSFNPIQWVKDLFNKGEPENQESGNNEEGNIPATFDIEKVAENLANMESFKLTYKSDIDFTANMDFMKSGTNLNHRLIEQNEANVEVEDKALSLTSSSNEVRHLSLTDLCGALGMSEEEVVENKSDIEYNTHSTVEIDAPNNKVVMTSVSTPFAVSRAYDEAAEQYYMIYDVAGMHSGTYLLESEVDEDEFDISAFLGDSGEFFDIVKDGNYNPETGILTKTFAEPIEFGSDSYVTQIDVTIRDNYITKLVGLVDVARSYNASVSEVNKNTFEYGFENINSTVVNVDSPTFACSSHKEVDYECLEKGHRPYCHKCNKYLGGIEEHHHNDHNYCEVCKGNYDVSDYIPEGYANKDGIPFVKLTKANNGSEIFSNGSINYNLDFEYGWEDMKSWYLFPEDGVVITYQRAYDLQYFIENNCAQYDSIKFTLYDGIEIVANGKDYTFDGHEKIADAIAGKTAKEVTATVLSLSHYSTTETTRDIDDCHTEHTHTCDRCHEVVEVEIEEHHLAQTWEELDENELPFKPAYPKEKYFRAECSHCNESGYYGVDMEQLYEHGENYIYAVQYDPEDGSVITYSAYVLIPHNFDENGHCSICDCQKYELGELVFYVTHDYKGRPYLIDPFYKATGEHVPYSNYDFGSEIVNEQLVVTYNYYDRNASDPEKVLLGQKIVHYTDPEGSYHDYVILSGGGESVTLTDPDMIV